MSDTPAIRLKRGEGRSFKAGGPWIYDNEIGEIVGDPADGDVIRIEDYNGYPLGVGFLNRASTITVRVLSRKADTIIDEAFLEMRVRAAWQYRKDTVDTSSCRIIFGEADFLPGIAADCYGREIRIIVSSRFADAFLPVIASELDAMLHPSVIESTVDRAYSSSEGLSERTRHFRDGAETKEGDERENALFIENGIYYEAASGKGQKSGFYADQRDNRQIAEGYASGRTVLDLFSYTGAFTLHMLRGGALSVDAVDSSESALRHLLYQIHLNENKGVLPPGSRDKVETHQGNAFEYIRGIEGGKYDMMILDPPKLAKTKSALEQAAKAYKDLNRVAMEKIRNGGIIATFSCSAAMTRENFRMMLSWAAADAGVEIQLRHVLHNGKLNLIRLARGGQML